MTFPRCTCTATLSYEPFQFWPGLPASAYSFLLFGVISAAWNLASRMFSVRHGLRLWRHSTSVVSQTLPARLSANAPSWSGWCFIIPNVHNSGGQAKCVVSPRRFVVLDWDMRGWARVVVGKLRCFSGLCKCHERLKVSDCSTIQICIGCCLTAALKVVFYSACVEKVFKSIRWSFFMPLSSVDINIQQGDFCFSAVFTCKV